MTLDPIRGAAKRQRLFVYDLEWYPDSMKLRLAGLFDGERYQKFAGVPGLMRAMLTRENSGAWFYAHFGGAADLAFLQAWFAEHPEYQVEMRFSGSAAVTVVIRRGHCTWHLVDSYFLMRDSLASIGRSLGMLKGTDGMTPEQKQAMFYAPDAELAAYNEQDCRILFAAIVRFRDELEALGGELRPTIASCAMNLFRRRFLRSPIRINERFNDRMREGYIASRVEVFRKRLEVPAFEYDINSSFPASMTEPCPGSPLGFGTKLPARGDCFAAEVTINVPRSCEVPPLPYRTSDRVFFPTGRWSALLSGPDVRFAEECGVLESVRMVWRFEERDDLADYVRTIYALRQEHKDADPFRGLVYKYLLNSLYGKFGEGTDKESILLNPSGSALSSGAQLLRPGAYRVARVVRAPHEHVALAAHVTAKSRARITRHLYDAREVYYCDTDSLVTPQVMPSSRELGALKLVKPVDRGYFAAPKFYMLDGKVKAKGFPALSEGDFWSLVQGGSTEVQRMSRVKEMWRDGQLDPSQRRFGKRARLTVDKRRFHDDGTSEPFDVAELAEVIAQSRHPGQLRLDALWALQAGRPGVASERGACQAPTTAQDL